MAEELAVSAGDHPARIGDQPERMPSFARTFPCGTGKRGLAQEDEAEGEIARACAGAQGIMDAEQQGEPGSPIGGRRGSAAGREASLARHPLKAGRSGKADDRTWIAQDDQAVGAARRSEAQAQAKPCRARCDNDMMFVVADPLGKRLTAARQRDCGYVGGLDHDNVGCGERRPERGAGSWIGVRRSGESSTPIVRLDPPLQLER